MSAIVVATLYIARDVLIPITLAVLLSFVLASPAAATSSIGAIAKSV